ncbi:MAG TPA: tetratricopeptide repeat protein [Candidatus Angelobacter sp.]|nr:tetratricopeptide repeat protein [Candidatus Angelobacter sp.]
MTPRRVLFVFLFVFVMTALSTPGFAQDDQDNQPHITPRKEEKQQRIAKPTPTPQPEPPPAGQSQPPQPTGESSSSAADADSGMSSSRDSQIDFNAGPRTAPVNPVNEDVNYDPHRAEKDIEVGNYYLRQKNYRAALERFHDALLYKPNDASATYGLGVTQEKLDLFSVAYNSYSKYLEILPHGPMAKEAEEGAKRMEQHLSPEDIQSSTARRAAEDISQGEKFLSRNEYDAARESFERALRLTPDNPAISFRMGQSLEGLQQPDAARMYYAKYLQLQPNGPFAAAAKKNIAQINDMIGK